MKKNILLVLGLVFMSSTAGFTAEQLNSTEKKEILECIHVNYTFYKKNEEEYKKNNILFRLISEKMYSEMKLMNNYPLYKKEHIKCYQLFSMYIKKIAAQNNN